MEDTGPKRGHGRVHFKRPDAVGYSNLVPASRLGRLASFGVDASLIFSIFMIGAIFSISLPFALVIIAAYIIMRDMVRGTGRSLGRAMSGQRLLNEDGSEAEPAKVIGRSVVRLLLWMTVLPFFIDLFMVIFGNGRIIADYIFETRVFIEPDVVKARRSLENSGQQSAPSTAEEDEEAELLREAAADIQFEGNDYNLRQLDDFESRLAGGSSSSKGSGDDDDLLSEFEARLNAAAASNNSEPLSFDPLDFDPDLLDDPSPAKAVEEVAVVEEETVTAEK